MPFPPHNTKVILDGGHEELNQQLIHKSRSINNMHELGDAYILFICSEILSFHHDLKFDL